jgi:sulfite reductase (NADPH) hemoprotein beta-component
MAVCNCLSLRFSCSLRRLPAHLLAEMLLELPGDPDAHGSCTEHPTYGVPEEGQRGYRKGARTHRDSHPPDDITRHTGALAAEDHRGVRYRRPVVDGLMIHRDFGDRTDRKHARFKYTIADRGVDWFKGELSKRLGYTLPPPRDFKFTTQGDRFGWLRGHDGRWHLTLRIESGRVVDRPGAPFLTGLEKIAAIHKGDFRLTANQNLIIANVPASECMNIDRLVADYGLGKSLFTTPVRRDALACVSLPSCGLAMAEAERYLPSFIDRVDALLAKHSLREIPLTVRITGCPNGCARPYLAEIALIGRAPGRYTLRLGADAVGSRLNVVYRDNIDEASIVSALDELLARYARERTTDERFGDFLWRVDVLKPEVRA